MLLSRFSRDSRLPCEIDKIVTRVQKRKLQVNLDDKVGLRKNVWAIPLNRGFILCAEGLVLHTDEIEPLRYLNGTHRVASLIVMPGMEAALEQLFYHELLSFGSNQGRLKEVKVGTDYATKYQNGDFVTFSMIPLAVELNITNTCNFNCIHCSKDSQPVRFAEELSIEEILTIIDECMRLGVPELRFMGGEPLIHPGFLKFVRRAKEKGVFQLRLSTNGWLIDDDLAKELSKYFESIQLSVHGASPSIHDTVVGKKGAWEQAKKAAYLLNKNGVKVNIGFTVMRENVGDISEMSQLALEWGVNSLGFLCLVPQGRGAQLKKWSTEEVLEMGETIKELKCRVGSCLNLDVAGFPPITPIKNDATIYGCEAGKTLMTIEPNGKVKACGILPETFGIQIRESTLLEVWHSPQFIKLRKQPNCKDCSYNQICWGPCGFLDGLR